MTLAIRARRHDASGVAAGGGSEGTIAGAATFASLDTARARRPRTNSSDALVLRAMRSGEGVHNTEPGSIITDVAPSGKVRY